MGKKVLILGINGFIGSHLSDSIMASTDWEIRGLDLENHNILPHMGQDRFTFKQGNMLDEAAWIEESIQWADTLLPLVAIANPALYVSDPLRVFDLDFQANLPFLELCKQHNTHLVFPSTSEVYGMCADPYFIEASSPLVLGPIHETRWIYSCIKQLLDRLIHAQGKKGLQYTLFRPFNWIGPRLDSLAPGQEYRARAITRFMADIVRQGKISLVDGGAQRRCFLDVRDGVQGLLTIIENKNKCADQEIFNLGDPTQNFSIGELAGLILTQMKGHASLKAFAEKAVIETVTAATHYGAGYADVTHRVPQITQAETVLGWQPTYRLPETLDWILSESTAQLMRGD